MLQHPHIMVTPLHGMQSGYCEMARVNIAISNEQGRPLLVPLYILLKAFCMLASV